MDMDESYNMSGQTEPYGRCDTCGAPCDEGGCTKDRTHDVAGPPSVVCGPPGLVPPQPAPEPPLSRSARLLRSWISSRSHDELEALDDALASWGEVLELTDGSTDGVAVLEAMLQEQKEA